MKFVKGILVAIVLLFMLVLGFASPAAIIGLIVFLIGLFLNRQYRSYKTNFNKSGWIMAGGFTLAIVLAAVFTDPAETVTGPEIKNTSKQEEIASQEQAAEKQKKAEEKKLAEEKAKEEEEKKQAEEKARLEAEKAEKEKQQQEEKAESLGLELVTVGRVVDGDTIETSDGRKVRLIGVNTPESTTRVEEYGKEASQYTSSKLTGKKVWMQRDVSEMDRYGRLLRIIWMEIPDGEMDESEIRSKMFNAYLVLNGFAEPSTYNPDVKYSEYFRKFGREAREANAGLWAFSNEGTTKGDLDSSGSAGNSSGSSSSGSSASNSSGSSEVGSSADTSSSESRSSAASGSGQPGSSSSSSSSAAESYKNCTELRSVYPNGVPSTHPAYEPRHDRDQDDWACER